MNTMRRCWAWGAILAALACSQVGRSGCCPAASAQGRDQIPAAKPKELDRFIFEMRDKPWVGKDSVLTWLGEKAELPVLINHKPFANFNFIAPPPRKGEEPRKYTIPEIIDILNEALSQQQLVLIRKREAERTLRRLKR